MKKKARKKKQKPGKKKYSKVPASLKSLSPPRKEKAGPEPPSPKPHSPLDMERMNRVISKLMSEREFDSNEEAERFMQTQIMGKNLDEILELSDYDPGQEAQELAYQALEAGDSYESLKLAKKALDLDPDCIDAAMLMAELTSRSLPERIEQAKNIVARAEEKFGPEYFEENKGHFWGMIETRPYMRALAFLIEAQKGIGDMAEAIHRAERMLELNPNDNQGIRDTLLGMYLETGNLDGARRLIKKYRSDYAAIFLWGEMLERFLSGDRKQAAKIYKRASERNPYVFDYITGKKRPPSEIADFYTLGDESEAVFCFKEIGPAWKKHPEAIEWLTSLR